MLEFGVQYQHCSISLWMYFFLLNAIKTAHLLLVAFSFINALAVVPLFQEALRSHRFEFLGFKIWCLALGQVLESMCGWRERNRFFSGDAAIGLQ